MFVGDYGIEVRLDTQFQLENVEIARIIYKKPSGTTGYWDAQVDGTELVYIIKEGDIDEAGIWFLQAYVKSSVYELTGNKVSYLVRERVNSE